MANNAGGMDQPMRQLKRMSKQKQLSTAVTPAAFVLAAMV
jgi:hypothetical protein